MRFLEMMASAVVPLIFLCAGCIFLFGQNRYFSAFLQGAEEGLKTAIGLLPTLVLLLAAVSMLKSSGATDFLAALLLRPAQKLGIPSEIVPLLLTRPFSGSASSAMFSSLLSDVGADSFAAMCAAVIMGSSDTVVYVISVYFSSVKVKKTGYAFPVAFAVMLFCVFFSCFLCRVWFR